MKHKILTLALVAATTGLTAFAQDATPTATPAGSPPARHEGWKKHREGPGPGGPMRAAFEALTPQEREQLKAAHKKVKDDPTVEAAHKKAEEARKAAFDAERAAMLKADPSIGPVLDKLEAARKAHRPSGPEGGPKPE